jgi:hypothetical protein
MEELREEGSHDWGGPIRSTTLMCSLAQVFGAAAGDSQHASRHPGQLQLTA